MFLHGRVNGTEERPRMQHARVLTAITDGSTLTLLKLSLTRTDEIDVDLDVLADETFAEEFARLLRIVGLLGVREPATPQTSAPTP